MSRGPLESLSCKVFTNLVSRVRKSPAERAGQADTANPEETTVCESEFMTDRSYALPILLEWPLSQPAAPWLPAAC